MILFKPTKCSIPINIFKIIGMFFIILKNVNLYHLLFLKILIEME